jgi:hypothetical protein
MPTKNKNGTGRCARNTRTMGSAAAFAGCIGLPEPASTMRLGDGGMEAFCRLFNRKADVWLYNRSPECRAFVQAEREARCL